MNSFCLIAYFTVIAAVIATADHAHHEAGSKTGDVVHWTIGANSKGAAQLNHTGTAHLKSVTAVTAPKTTTSTTASSTVVATDAKVAKEVTQASEATTAGGEAVKHEEGDTANPTSSTEATVTTTAAPEVTGSTEKLIHKY